MEGRGDRGMEGWGTGEWRDGGMGDRGTEGQGEEAGVHRGGFMTTEEL